MILADVGEVGILYKGREIILRPSLYNMSTIADKKEIVNIFSYVMSGDHSYALHVINCCCDEDLTDIYGLYELSDDGHLEFYDGEVSKQEAIIIAQSLLKHGMIGDVKREGVETKEDYEKEFDARKYVAIAIACLGVSSEEAWKMTMTTFAGAMQIKYPPIEDKNKKDFPTVEEAVMASKWLDEVNKLRKE